jgi:uncharacterized protein (TIGR02466 family)
MNHAHHSSNPLDFVEHEIYKELPVLDVKQDVIFPVFLYKFKLDIDNKKILEECLQLREIDPKGVRFSNVGGWQSDNYCLININRNLTPNIQTLAYNVILAANDISKDYELNVEFGPPGCEWWVNVNQKECYNVVHSHPGCDIIALYYPKISGNNDGTVTFVRTDGAQYSSLYEANNEQLNYELVAEEGIIYLLPSHLLHFVKPNLSNDYRVSIAFNLSINK